MQKVRKNMSEVYQEALFIVENQSGEPDLPSVEQEMPQSLSEKSSISGDCDWDEEDSV